ncbi:MAG: T9SS type A sorting domain-containing protein, partial [Candidatus Cloacimonetes bacterium]|nr:T9SS type A sorting domain-containing protein [Candidatus Cloacimonadota bacterium]
VPEWEFIKDPTTIMTSYYDYQPGAYESHPIRLQTDWGDGVYLTFFGMASTDATRRQYWAYLDSNLDLLDWGTMTSYERWQGFGGIAVHPATGNCLATWHEDEPPDDGILETTITYDDYDLCEIPGFWQTPTLIYSEEPNEYIWPRIFVGPSPEGLDYVRVYQLANSYGSEDDVRFMYNDVQNINGADLTGLLDPSNWTTLIVPGCGFQSFAIDYNDPGKVGFIGYTIDHLDIIGPVFAWESFDYGETWDYANLHLDGIITDTTAFIYLADNIPGFVYEDEVLEYLEVATDEGHHDTAQYDSDGNLHTGYLQVYGIGSFFFQRYMHPAEIVWNGTNFSYHEVPGLPGIDPLSGHTVPWEIDPVTGDTLLYTTVGYCKYPTGSWQEGGQKKSINVESKMILQMWADGTYVQLAQDNVPGYEDYSEHPILYISVSRDNGETWSETIKLTDIYYPDFDFSEQITVYPYVCDQIVDLGDDWGQVFIFYWDDNAFGSEVAAPNEGGQITYCSIKIHFPEYAVDPDNTNITNLSLTNYPNPFSASTHISFSGMKNIQNSVIEIYNIKGQLVRTLEPSIGSSPDEGYALWDGKDKNNNDVTNGIYFYKLETELGSITNKMLIVR